MSMRGLSILPALCAVVLIAGCQSAMETVGVKSPEATVETRAKDKSARPTPPETIKSTGPAASAPPVSPPTAAAAPVDTPARAAALDALRLETEREVAEGRMTWEMAAKRQHRFAIDNGLARGKADEDYWQSVIAISRNLDNRYISPEDAKASLAEAERQLTAQKR
jgi:hypothetical protein